MSCMVCLFFKWPEHLKLIWHWIASNGVWGVAALLNSHPQPASSSHLETAHRKIPLTAAQPSVQSGAIKMVRSACVSLPVRPVMSFLFLRGTLFSYLEFNTNLKSRSPPANLRLTTVIKYHERNQGINTVIIFKACACMHARTHTHTL